MIVEEVTSDITKTVYPVIIHGCNAQGKANSGVAKAIRQSFPNCFNDYFSAYYKNQLKLGSVIYWNGQKTICHAITQQFYGYDKKMYVSYDAIRNCLFDVRSNIAPDAHIAMPRLGAGRGGGNWVIIKDIINTIFIDHSVTIYYIPE